MPSKRKYHTCDVRGQDRVLLVTLETRPLLMSRWAKTQRDAKGPPPRCGAQTYVPTHNVARAPTRSQKGGERAGVPARAARDGRRGGALAPAPPSSLTCLSRTTRGRSAPCGVAARTPPPRAGGARRRRPPRTCEVGLYDGGASRPDVSFERRRRRVARRGSLRRVHAARHGTRKKEVCRTRQKSSVPAVVVLAKSWF